MKKIDHPPPTFSLAALGDLLFQQIKVFANHMVFSVCIRFREETLSLPLIIIDNLKPQKAESRADVHPKGKKEGSSFRGSNHSGKEAPWEAWLTTSVWPQIYSSHPLLFPSLWGGRKRRRAELPYPVQQRPEGLNIVIQPWGAHKIKDEAGEWNCL